MCISDRYVFGYEESYGSLIKPFVRDKDAPQACLMLAEAACYYKAKGKTLVDVLYDLYAELGYYEESQTSLKLEGQAGAERIQEILATLRKSEVKEINATKVTRFEDYKECRILENGVESELCGFTKSDVLKYYLEDGSWIAIRPVSYTHLDVYKRQVQDYNDLYAYWQDTLAKVLLKEVHTHKEKYLLNLSSKEYEKAIRPYIPKEQWIDVIFQVEKKGKRKVEATQAKMARGRMVHFLAQRQVETLAEVYQFQEDGYQLDKERTGNQQIVFYKKG